MPLLTVENLTMRFGGITAVNRVELAVNAGEIVSVIGPNGAGKTTVFNAVTGIYEPTAGRVTFDGKAIGRRFGGTTAAGAALTGACVAAVAVLLAVNVDLLWKHAVRDNYPVINAPFPWGKAADDARGHVAARGWAAVVAAVAGFVVGGGGALAVWWRARRTPDVISQAGIARTFQNIRLFRAMTVLENVMVGMTRSMVSHPLLFAFNLGGHRREEREAAAKAAEWLAFVGLGGKHNALAANLAYGDQRRLEIARALATNPKLLLLDEPAAGMNPSETAALMGLIRKIRDRGVTVLLIEHHMNLVMGISDRVAVLDYGVKIAEGTPDEVRRDPKVIAAYLGQEDAA